MSIYNNIERTKMKLDSRKNGFLDFSVCIDEMLAKVNIQQYYSEENGFDFKLFVQMAMDFDEVEAENIMSDFIMQEQAKTQMNIEDTSFNFSDEELNLIYLDIMNLKIA